jgi:hypothetical protein
MYSIFKGVIIGLLFASALAGAIHPVAAQQPAPLCDPAGAANAETPVPGDPLQGRLGGTREAFEARFGPPSEEDDLSISYELAGCGNMSVEYQEGILTDIDFFAPGYLSGEAEWTFAEAQQIASRLLPLDVEVGEPFRNVSFVEHHPCSSQTLATQVPMSVYEYVDNNPTAGQCSAVYEFNDAGDVVSIGVQLQIEDPT